MDAPVVYFVRFWIKPGGERKVLDWLDGGHMQNVVQQPGFLWARRYELSEADDEGWTAHAMVYGLQSQFVADRSVPADDRCERLPFDHLDHIRRQVGGIEQIVLRRRRIQRVRAGMGIAASGEVVGFQQIL